MEISEKNLNLSPHPAKVSGASGAHDSVQLLEKARADTDTVLKELGSQLGGLSAAEADSRMKQFGTNEIAREKRQSVLMRLLSNVKNPLVLLLMALGVLSFLTGDLRATVVIFVMVVLGVVLRFFQEMRADNAAAKLQAMVSNKATVVRDGKDAEVSLKLLVPGDIIRLAAGDIDRKSTRPELQSPCNLVCRLLLEKKNRHRVPGVTCSLAGGIIGELAAANQEIIDNDLLLNIFFLNTTDTTKLTPFPPPTALPF